MVCTVRYFVLLYVTFGTAGAAFAQLATARSGMVSTAHPIATETGVEILRQGGNAFDAAVAVAAMLNVVEPQNSGVGGFGLILIYDAAKRQVRVLNASGRIPQSADPEAFRNPANRRGPKTITAPVNARAWEQLSKNYGRLPWRSLFRPAVEKAERGFPLLNSIPEDAYRAFPDCAKAIYAKNGKPLGKGNVLVQRELGRSLRLIASQGPDVLHGGALGRTIAQELTRVGSFVTLADLANSRPEWWEPISIDYRGYQVVTASPPANSFTALICLGILAQWELGALSMDSPEYWHRVAEVTKHAEWCRLRYAGDPDVAAPPLAKLLSVGYWQEQAAKVNEARASEFVPPGVAGGESSDTTHFVVADQWGNVVSATQTIGNVFGSRVMAPGTGIWLNDSLSYSTFEPRGNPMDVHPGRRKLISNAPAFVMKQGRPWVALGAAGGHTIPQTVSQVLSHIIDHGMDIARALEAPRISFLSEGNTLAVESRLPEQIRENLQARGHKISVQDIGRLQALTIEFSSEGKPRQFQGSADPRGAGTARGY